MNWKLEYTRSLIGGAILCLIAWYFTSLLVFLFISAIIGSIGQPLVQKVSRIKIRKKNIGTGIGAAITLFAMISIIVTISILLIPAIINQANSISEVNFDIVSSQLDSKLDPLERTLKERSLMRTEADFGSTIREHIVKLVGNIHFNQIFSNVLGFTGEIFMAVFSILFMSFFFLKDKNLFPWIVMLFVSQRNHKKAIVIMEKVRRSLNRYFVGLIIEVSSMMLLITIGGLIIGLENAILIGFIGGLMNVIPYLGPLIGASIGTTLVVISNITFGIDVSFILSGQLLIVFAVANMIDNFVLQPIIYSNSINVHPMAIFIIIFAGGMLGGSVGMIVAIPIFTVLRIIFGEFFGDYPLIKKITTGS